MNMLVSGGFGFAGHYLVYGLLKQGHHVILIGRRKDSQTILSRLETLKKNNAFVNPEFSVHPDTFGKITVLEGNISKEKLGLSETDYKFLKEAKLDAIHNMASCLRYEDKHRAECYGSNVYGTEQFVELALANNCPYFHSSTAYIAGDQVPSGQLTKEEFYETKNHPNVYLESKSAAESLLNKYHQSHDLDYYIFRLPTLVGDSKTGFTNSIFGIYEYLCALDRLRSRADIDSPIRFHAIEGGNLNMLPVDIVISCYLKICQSVNRDKYRIFNITDGQPISIALVGELLGNMFGVAMKASDTMPDTPENIYERLFARLTSRNTVFIRHNYRFDNSNSVACLGHPVSQGWNKGPEYFHLFVDGFQKAKAQAQSLPA